MSDWDAAQIAERAHASPLWLDLGHPGREAIEFGEKMKGAYLIKHLEYFLGASIESLAFRRDVLDIACGPVSSVSQFKCARSVSGVDPLIYPDWVYRQYELRDFLVHRCKLEELARRDHYDLAVAYNALQHFEDLAAAVAAVHRLLMPRGELYIVDYLHVPTDQAHLQYLTKDRLDTTFTEAGFSVRSCERAVRLDHYVERYGGAPIEIYLGRMTKP